MMVEKRIRKRIEQIDQNIGVMVENPYQAQKHFPMWAKIVVPVSSVALSLAIALAVTIPIIQKSSGLTLNQLTRPRQNKIVSVDNDNISSLTYDSYNSFVKKFVSLAMLEGNKGPEKSIGMSIPDSYISFAIAGLISDSACLNDVLSYYELPDVDSLKIAVKEVSSVLATISKDKQGRLSGGYNLNSIWLNPEEVNLNENVDQQLLSDLEECFDAAIFYEELTNETANEYIKKNSLNSLPMNKISLPESESSAIDLMSLYRFVDSFESDLVKTYKTQFEKGNHKIPFNLNGTINSVDYIEKVEEGVPIYEGDGFYGASISMNHMGMDFYLPTDEQSMPSAIMRDVLEGNYQNKITSYIDSQTGEERYITRYEANVKVPYFYMENNVYLDSKDLIQAFPNLTTNGLGYQLINGNGNDSVYLEWFKQFSTMKFDYRGFYSSSVSINNGGSKGGSNDFPDKFELVLDHPFIFKVNKNVKIDDSNIRYKMPIVFGEIVNPNYSK